MSMFKYQRKKQNTRVPWSFEHEANSSGAFGCLRRWWRCV